MVTVVVMGAQQRIETAVAIAADYGQVADPAEKAWVIDQIVRTLLGRRYDEWVSAYRTNDSECMETRQWNEGRPPRPTQLALVNW